MGNKRKEKKLRAKYDEKHVELPAEEKYKTDMAFLLGHFTTNDKNPALKGSIVERSMSIKRELDIKAIKEKFPGFVIVDHVLLTRHGESGAKEKMGGLSPNAPLSERQIEGIHDAQTNQYTHHFLSDPDQPPTVVSSTMLRAKNTAVLITPPIKLESFTLNKQFTEEGKYASSAAYTSTSGTKTGWGRFLGFVKPSILRKRAEESAEVDQEIRALRSRTGGSIEGDLHDSYHMDPQYQANPIDQKNKKVDHFPVDMKKKGQHISSPTPDTSEPDITFLSTGDKLAAINNSIINHIGKNKGKKSGDFWAFIHGGLGKKIMKSKFGLEYKWDYLATKEIYILKGPDGKLIEYSPPGAIRVGVNGEFEGVFRKNERALVSADFDRVQMLTDSKIVLENKMIVLMRAERDLQDMQGAEPETLRTNITKLNELKAFEPHTTGAEKKDLTKEIDRITEVINAELNKTTILEAKTNELEKMILDVKSGVEAVRKNTSICKAEEQIKTNKAVNKIENKSLMRKSVKKEKIREVEGKLNEKYASLDLNFKKIQKFTAHITNIHETLKVTKVRLETHKADNQTIMNQPKEKIDAPQEPRRMSGP